MTTIAESIQEKAKKIKRWKEENPGLEWNNPKHPHEQEKIYLSKELIFSEAYLSLSRVSLLVYNIFLSKRWMKRMRRNRNSVWVCTNNGEIIFTYVEALGYGFSRVQFRNAIDELQQKGFIDITHAGKGGRPPAVGKGDCTTYWIDDRWLEYGTDNFRPPRCPRQKDNRTDRGFSDYWKKKGK